MLKTTLADRPAKTASQQISRCQKPQAAGELVGGGGCLPRKASSLHVPEWLSCQHPVAGL